MEITSRGEADSKLGRQVKSRAHWNMGSIWGGNREKRVLFEIRWSEASLKKTPLMKDLMKIRKGARTGV